MIDLPQRWPPAVIGGCTLVGVASAWALPFGHPTVSAAILFMFGVGIGELVSTYYVRTDRRWAWSPTTAVLVAAYALDPGAWLLLAVVPLAVGQAIRNRPSPAFAVTFVAARTSAFLLGGVASHLFYVSSDTMGLHTVLVAASLGIATYEVYSAAVFAYVLDPGQVFALLIPWGLAGDCVLGYLGLLGVVLWTHSMSLLIGIGPLLLAGALAPVYLERVVLRVRMYTAIAEAQARVRSQSVLDTAWAVAHAVIRLAGTGTDVEMAVVGTQTRFYDMVAGTPVLREQGTGVLDRGWVTLIRDSSTSLLRRPVGAGVEYLFRVGEPAGSTMLFRVVVPPHSQFVRRMPEQVLREFIASATRWIAPTVACADTVPELVRASARHLVSLLEYPGEIVPVREVLVELHRIEELTASALTGSSSTATVHAETAPSVSLGVWPGADL